MSSWHVEQGLWIVLKGVVRNSADWEWNIISYSFRQEAVEIK